MSAIASLKIRLQSVWGAAWILFNVHDKRNLRNPSGNPARDCQCFWQSPGIANCGNPGWDCGLGLPGIAKIIEYNQPLIH